MPAHPSFSDEAMAVSMTRPSNPTPRSSAIVLQSELAELRDAGARLAGEVVRLERHVSMLSTEVAAADQKVADLEKLQIAARGPGTITGLGSGIFRKFTNIESLNVHPPGSVTVTTNVPPVDT